MGVLAQAIACTVLCLASLISPVVSTLRIQDNAFTLDGRPLRLISCSIHYIRIPQAYWLDRLKRVQSLGCNSIQMYIPWNFHEPAPNAFDFEGQRDVVGFINLAHGLGMHVLLRPGPYVCGEWDFGGFPAWMLDPKAAGGDMLGRFRTADPLYLRLVERWWDTLLPLIVPLLHANGGPVIMVQLENEFGYFNPTGDTVYLRRLLELGQKYLGKSTQFYTTDAPRAAKQGGLPGDEVLSIVDFGPHTPVAEAFAKQAEMNPPGKSPAMCSEYYTGWLTHWGESIANSTADDVTGTLREILQFNNGTGNVNFYMGHGGTSFGFWAGANADLPDITSYDYDCTVSEAGRQGQPGVGGANKFKAVRDVLVDITGAEPPPFPQDIPARSFGQVSLPQRRPLLDSLEAVSAFATAIESNVTEHMESYGCGAGFILYRTHVPCEVLSGGTLHLHANDAARVYVNGTLAAKAWRHMPYKMKLPPLTCSKPATVTRLEILVQAMGRENFFAPGTALQLQKGIIEPVFIDPGNGSATHVLQGWQVFPVPLNSPGELLWPGEMDQAADGVSYPRKPMRKSFDSLTGNCWRGFDTAEAAPNRALLSRDAATPLRRADTGAATQYLRVGKGVMTAGDGALAGRADELVATAESGTSAWDWGLRATVQGYVDDTTKQVGSGAGAATSGELVHGPVFLRGTFEVSAAALAGLDALPDTFLRTDGFHKGVAWVNGHNLGHYWPAQGPQMTLFVPGPFLVNGTNEVVLMEMDAVPPHASVEFVDQPDFRGPNPPSSIVSAS